MMESSTAVTKTGKGVCHGKVNKALKFLKVAITSKLRPTRPNFIIKKIILNQQKSTFEKMAVVQKNEREI
jgi:hypothetical protein